MAGAVSGLERASAPVAVIHARTHRLIASRWPTVGVFETVASPEDLEAALQIETLTNDRVTETLARLARIDHSEWVIDQPGATLVMAAFLHPAPGGGRFNTDALGAWYCATELETAVAETVYHHTKRLAHSSGGFWQVIQMRQLISDVRAELHDVRSFRTERPELYDPDSYEASQRFGEGLRRAGSNGIVFESVRRAGGTNLAVFRPPLLIPVLQGDHFDYRWAGDPVPEVVRLTSVGIGAAGAKLNGTAPARGFLGHNFVNPSDLRLSSDPTK